MECSLVKIKFLKTFLLSILNGRDIDMCLIQETFFIQEDKFFLNEWRVFRADANTKRKGVCILVRSNLKVKVTTLLRDDEAIFIKIKLTDIDNASSITISSAYFEHTSK